MKDYVAARLFWIVSSIVIQLLSIIMQHPSKYICAEKHV